MRRARAGGAFAVLLTSLPALGACGLVLDQRSAESSVLPVVERPQTPGSAASPPGVAGGASGSAAVTVTVVPTSSPTPTGTPSAAPEPTSDPSATAAAPEPAATSGGSEPASERERLEAAAVERTNAERADAGCGTVHVDERLVAAARAHSEDMAERDFFDHTNPDGETPWDRAKEAGYEWPASENIAHGYPTGEAVVAGWMDSDGHRRNILDCDVVAVGIGVAESSSGPYWTQMFGHR